MSENGHIIRQMKRNDYSDSDNISSDRLHSLIVIVVW